MDKNTKQLIQNIEKNINEIEEKANRYFENIDEIKKECERNLGFKEHYFWHMNFNSSNLRHLDNIFTATNCYSFSSFNRRIENEFKRISKITNIDKDTLIFLYNRYLIDLEQKKSS